MTPRLSGLAAFARALWLSRRLRTPAQVKAFQAGQLARFLSETALSVRAFPGLGHRPLTQWPLMDKAALMADFGAYNRLGLDAADAWDVYNGTHDLPGYSVGASTGTSGNRGLFLVSDAERFFWLGVMLARALPQVFWQPHRVALVLPTTSRLYETANESRRLALRFFDVGEGASTHVKALEDFNPTVLIASPHALRALAEADTGLAPRHVFSGAEVLDPLDRAVVESRWGVVLREIYMATEGLFGISCAHGTLHLVEDHVHVELVPQSGGLFAPVITDFSRRTQAMVRYQMNDLLELAPAPCVCGSPLTALKAVHGRADDVFVFACGTRVTPDVIRNAIVTTSTAIADFRADQIDEATVAVILPLGPDGLAEAVRANLAMALQRAGVRAPATISVRLGDFPPMEAKKLRRVSRLWQDAH